MRYGELIFLEQDKNRFYTVNAFPESVSVFPQPIRDVRD